MLLALILYATFGAGIPSDYPAAYAIVGPGGTTIPITGVTYDAVADTAVLDIDPSFQPLADGLHQLTLASTATSHSAPR